MIFLLDFVQDVYSQVMAIVNYVCFGAVCLCFLYIYVAYTIGQFNGYYKHGAVGSFVIVVVLFGIHFYMLETFQIPLIVPPLETPYFTDFFRPIQGIASISLIVLLCAIFTLAPLSRVDSYYGRSLVSAIICLIVMIVIHFWLEENFDILLIFPPNLW